MATTTKKTTTAHPKTERVTTVTDSAPVDNKIAKENEELKKQIEGMQAQMDLLIKQMALQSSASVTSKKAPEKNIKFINLVPGVLILKGSQNWKIDGQFNSRTFLKSEAELIVNNMRNTVRDGYVYITDEDFIKENELESAYTNLLSDTKLKDLLNHNFNEVISIYKTVPKAQQDIIVSMIKEKKQSGVSIDANILIEIGKLCGQDLLHEVEYEDEEG